MKSLNTVAVAALVLTVFFLIGSTGCKIQSSEVASAKKDYSNALVSDLSLDEQLVVARSVELSSVVIWGEGGPLYSREVAEAFLLDYPFPNYLEERYGKYEPASPWERERNAVAFLSQSPVNDSSMPGVYLREIWLYTGSGAYQIFLYVDAGETILESSTSFLANS